MSKLIFRSKDRFEPDGLIEIVVWELDTPLHPCTHCYKYRLYFGMAGASVVRYDNERGKGDHVHYGETEQPYAFTTLEQLLKDFLRDTKEVKP